MRRSLLFVLPTSLAVAGLVSSCGGAAPAPMKHADLMSQTKAGQERCAMTKSHERPFVIEWDATDLASFEAKAQRDVVFVRYEGCHLTVLYGCSDESIPGKLGAYSQPLQTAGTVEAVDIEDEGDLYTELPLSAAKLSARVESGDALHMRYFVSGVVTATRDSITRPTLASYPACKDATHFVWAYNLGAFELTTSSHDKAAASATVLGAGGGGSKSHGETRLKTGGDLASCTGETAATTRACRVPIRLALRKVSDVVAEAPASPAPGGSSEALAAKDPPSEPVAAKESTPSGGGDSSKEAARKVLLAAVKGAQENSRARVEAGRKLELGDGAACLADLDKLAQKHPESHHDDDLRSRCEMAAGKCDAGKSRYRMYLEREIQQTGRTMDIDQMVQSRAAKYCKGTQGTTRERAMRAKDQVLSASMKKDAAACVSSGRDLMTAITALEKGTDTDRETSRQLSSYAMNAVQCAAKGGKCAEAREIYAQHFKIINPKASTKDMERGFVMVAHDCPSR